MMQKLAGEGSLRVAIDSEWEFENALDVSSPIFIRWPPCRGNSPSMIFAIVVTREQLSHRKCFLKYGQRAQSETSRTVEASIDRLTDFY